MASAIESAAFGSEPAFEKREENSVEEPDLSEKNKTKNESIIWTEDAEQYLQEAPKFVRTKIRNNAENKALYSKKTSLQHNQA